MTSSQRARRERSAGQLIDAGHIQERLDELRADYQIERRNRFRRDRPGVSGTGRSADWHHRNETRYIEGIELARDVDRNDMIVGQGLNRLCDNLFQDTGLRPDPQTGSDDLNDRLKEKWNEWAGEPELVDVAGEHDFYGMERFVFRDSLVAGDIIGVGPAARKQLQLIENHRLRTPTRTRRNVVLGVLLDNMRRRIEYWVAPDHIDPLRSSPKVGDLDPLPTRDKEGNRQVFHVYDPRRVSDTRGTTVFNPIIDVAGNHDDLQFAKLVQAQIVSCFAILEERMENFDGDGGGVQTGERTTESVEGTFAKILEGLRPGLHIRGEYGSKLTGFSPAVPNAEFFDHAYLLLSIIAVNIGMPVAVLMLDPRQTNFSGWRGSIDQARLGWKRIQRWLTTRWHKPVWRWKVRQWMREDSEIRMAAQRESVKIFKHVWRAPRWPYIEPSADAQADLIRIRNSLTSRRRLHAERGEDWDEVLNEIITDNSASILKAHEAAQKLNQIEGLEVTWRDVLHMATPDGVTMSRDAGDPGSNQPPPTNGAPSNGNGRQPARR